MNRNDFYIKALPVVVISSVTLLTFQDRAQFVLTKDFPGEQAQLVINKTIETKIPVGCKTQSGEFNLGYYNEDNFHSIDLKSNNSLQFISIRVESLDHNSNPKIYLKSDDGEINQCWDLLPYTIEASSTIQTFPTLSGIPGNQNYKVWIGDNRNLNNVNYILVVKEQN